MNKVILCPLVLWLRIGILGVAVYVIQADTVHTVTVGLHMPGKKKYNSRLINCGITFRQEP